MQPQNTTLVEPGVYKMNLGKGADGVTDTYKYVDKTGANLSNYKPAMQTTAQQTRQDITTGQKIDAMAGQTPTAPNSNVQNNGQQTGQNNQQTTDGTQKTAKTFDYKNPDGTNVSISETAPTNTYAYTSPTALADGEKFGYGSDGKRYIVGKDGSIKNDAYADQEYEANKTEINREKERTALFDSMKTNLDNAHIQLLDSIKATFQVRRAKMEDINKRYTALKQNEGFSGGTARYMSDINNGVLQDTEQQGEIRLAEIDAQEKSLVAQAVQAKTSKDFELAFKKMDEIDKLQKEKTETIQKVYKAAVDYNKALDDQEKELRLKEKDQFDMATKSLTASAPALVNAYNTLKSEKEKQTFITNMAKKLGVGEEIVLGAMEDQRTQNTKDTADVNAKNRSNQPKAKGGTVDEFGNEVDTTEDMTPEEQARVQKSQDFFTKVESMIASNFKNSEGVPVVTDKGYLTYKAFRDLWTTAQEMGITREEFIKRFQSRVNLSTFAKTKSGYGLTDSEYNMVKGTK